MDTTKITNKNKSQILTLKVVVVRSLKLVVVLEEHMKKQEVMNVFEIFYKKNCGFVYLFENR